MAKDGTARGGARPGSGPKRKALTEKISAGKPAQVIDLPEGADLEGVDKYFWLYKVKFGIPATALATKGDSITFNSPTIEGTILRRNKPDAKGHHPWKAEVTEGDPKVNAATITNWYQEVYEPSFDAVETN